MTSWLSSALQTVREKVSCCK